MSNFYPYNPTGTTHGKYIQRDVSANSDADRWRQELHDMLVQQLDGDGSQDSHYATIVTLYGFADQATAHAWFNEFMSCFGKTSGDGDVSSVRAARDQYCARSRM